MTLQIDHTQNIHCLQINLTKSVNFKPCNSKTNFCVEIGIPH